MVLGFELKGWAVDMSVVVKDLYIGRVGAGDRFFLEVEVRSIGVRGGLTVEHRLVSDGAQELSMRGLLIREGGSVTNDGDWLSCGQNVDDLRAVVTLPDGQTVECERNMANTGWGWLHWVDGVGTCLTVFPDAQLTRNGRGNRFLFTPKNGGK